MAIKVPRIGNLRRQSTNKPGGSRAFGVLQQILVTVNFVSGPYKPTDQRL